MNCNYRIIMLPYTSVKSDMTKDKEFMFLKNSIVAKVRDYERKNRGDPY